jgi:hypothetical protein
MSPLRPRTTPTLLRAATLLLVTVLGLLMLGTGPATAKDDVTWAVRTASNNLGQARTSYSYALNPGAKINDALIVANHGTAPLTLAVYASDGYTTESGQFDLLTTGAKSANIGIWVHPASDSVTIKAGATTKVPFTIEIPDNATPGDYAGGIVTSLVQEDQTEGINVDRRLGVRMQMRIGGDLAPKLAVENLKIDYSGSAAPFARGDAKLTYEIHNTGNAILSAHQTASINGPFGTFKVRAGEIKDSPALLPGEKWKVSVPLDGVAPSFRLSADVALTPVLIDAAGSTSTLKIVHTSGHAWALPWSLLLLVVVLVGVVVLAVQLVGRGRTRRQELEEARVQGAVAEALRERETQQS